MSDADEREKIGPASGRRSSEPPRREPPKNAPTLLGLPLPDVHPDLAASPPTEASPEKAEAAERGAVEEVPASSPSNGDRASAKPPDPSKVTPAANFISASSFVAEPDATESEVPDLADDIPVSATPQPWQAARKPALKVMTDRFPTNTAEIAAKSAEPVEAVPDPVKRSLLVPGLIALGSLAVAAVTIGLAATSSTSEPPAQSPTAAASAIAAPTMEKAPAISLPASPSASASAAIPSPDPSSVVSANTAVPPADSHSSAMPATSPPAAAPSSRPLKPPGPVGDPEPY
jgi:hypothetical protein